MFFSTRQAAKYLQISRSTLKYHLYEAKTLEGALVGNSLVFTKEQLDQFKLIKRPQGRPKKELE